MLVSTLGRAIQEQYPSSITLLVDSSQLRHSSIAALVKQECNKRHIAVEGTRLQDILEALVKDKRSLLLVVDEAQVLYPYCNTPSQKEAFAHTSALVDELHVLAQQPGCVCWLVGSQALYHLAFSGRHPKYYGVYHKLNDKKYAPLNHLALRDPISIQEFLQVDTKQVFSAEEVSKYYGLYGGAMGDLIQLKPLSRTNMEGWDKSTHAILVALLMAQPTPNRFRLWDMEPILGRTAREIIERILPGCNPGLKHIINKYVYLKICN